VLNLICDDYEKVDQVILPHVANEGAKLGLKVERYDVVDAFAQFIEEGLA